VGKGKNLYYRAAAHTMHSSCQQNSRIGRCMHALATLQHWDSHRGRADKNIGDMGKSSKADEVRHKVNTNYLLFRCIYLDDGDCK
jgi:hypothetical protein